jgi:HEPN domain-containing protein
MKRETVKWVRKAEQDWEVAHKLAKGDQPPRDIVCFHCQQAAEKYLKALLQENGLVVPKTHELADILDLLVPGDVALARLTRKADSLTQYAVDYRYPGMMASKRQMEAALRHVDRIRLECRSKLKLSPP